MADCYFAMGNLIQYEYLLRNSVKDGYATNDELEKAYGKLIDLYKNRNDYFTIHSLLSESNNDKIKSRYQNLIAYEPEFSYPEGTYEEIVPLKLSSNTTGTIYYTLDGTDPTVNSNIYTAPIFLDDGSYRIKAIFINENNVSSKIVEKFYFIDVDIPNAPTVITRNGTYIHPTWIEVESVDDEVVYYTTAGTAPTTFSNIYTHPLPMPLGERIVQLATLDNKCLFVERDCASVCHLF